MAELVLKLIFNNPIRVNTLLFSGRQFKLLKLLSNSWPHKGFTPPPKRKTCLLLIFCFSMYENYARKENVGNRIAPI